MISSWACGSSACSTSASCCGYPGSRGRFAAVEIVESGQARGSERRKILRDRSDFLEQKGFFKLGLKLDLVVAPAAEQVPDAGFGTRL